MRSFVSIAAIIIFFIAASLFSIKAVAQTIEVRGEVKDQRDAVIVGAKIILIGGDGVADNYVSDGEGRFHIKRLKQGSYTLRIVAEGFGVYEEILKLDSSAAPFRSAIILYPSIKETVSSSDNNFEVALDPARAAGAQVLSEQMLKSLPDDPDQFRDLLQLLATSSGGVPGEATVSVDGFTIEGRLPPKSSIREVRINNNIFSAEYDKPPYRGGRIDIYTKPGASAFHGTGFFNFNNSVLNARDVFAPQRAPITTKRYGLQFGGPITRGKSGFLFDFEARDIDESTTINAIVLDNNFQKTSLAGNVPTPKSLLFGSLRADWQTNQNHTLIFRYDTDLNQSKNQNVGGDDLSSRAVNSRSANHSFRFTDTANIGQAGFNEFRFGMTYSFIRQRAASNAVAVIIPGAFNSGGATLQSLTQKEWRMELTDNYSLATDNHSLKIGIQIRGQKVDDAQAENFNGSFYFGGAFAPQLNENGQVVVGTNGAAVLVNISGLEQYRRTLLGLSGGTPTRFSIARGNPSLKIKQWTFAGFIQDEWTVRNNVLLSLGLRYEAQTNPTDKISFAPRIGIGYSPDKKRLWVFRARAGLFFDRLTLPLSLETQRSDGVRVQQILIDAPSFPNPFQSGNAADVILSARQINPQLKPPTSFQFQLGFERQLPRGWKLDTSYYISRSWGMLLSRNINAPIIGANDDPDTAPRPFGIKKNITQFESSGSLKGQVLYVGISQTRSRHFNLFSGYLWFNFRTNADKPFLQPQSSYNLQAELARPIWQARHRAFLVGLFNLPRKLKVSAELNIASGTPFDITTGRDNNGDGNFNDRPGLAQTGNPNAIQTRFGLLDPTVLNGSLGRNIGTNPFNATLDFNLSRTFGFGGKNGKSEQKYQLTLNIRANNLLNRANLSDVDGVLTSPSFGSANSAGLARRIEIGARFTF